MFALLEKWTHAFLNFIQKILSDECKIRRVEQLKGYKLGYNQLHGWYICSCGWLKNIVFFKVPAQTYVWGDKRIDLEYTNWGTWKLKQSQHVCSYSDLKVAELHFPPGKGWFCILLCCCVSGSAQTPTIDFFNKGYFINNLINIILVSKVHTTMSNF